MERSEAEPSRPWSGGPPPAASGPRWGPRTSARAAYRSTRATHCRPVDPGW